MTHLFRVVLGTCGEYRAYAQVIRSPLLRQDRLFHGLRGNAQYFVRTQEFAHVAGFHVMLSHVDAIRAHGQGDVHVVVDYEGNCVLPA